MYSFRPVRQVCLFAAHFETCFRLQGISGFPAVPWNAFKYTSNARLSIFVLEKRIQTKRSWVGSSLTRPQNFIQQWLYQRLVQRHFSLGYCSSPCKPTFGTNKLVPSCNLVGWSLANRKSFFFFLFADSVNSFGPVHLGCLFAALKPASGRRAEGALLPWRCEVEWEVSLTRPYRRSLH